MEGRYTGAYIQGDSQISEGLAWNDWLFNLVAIVRRYPEASFGWRTSPRYQEDKDFDRSTVTHRIYGRLIIDCLGEPVPAPLKYYEDGAITGFGLAQQVDDGQTGSP